jgi:8-oxo-dGTP pyrophosphatase MutT (NUDIX family)
MIGTIQKSLNHLLRSLFVGVALIHGPLGRAPIIPPTNSPSGGVGSLEDTKEHTTNEIARVSATLLLTRDDPFEVLMVRRNSSGTFASSLVFPGGAIEQSDASDNWSAFVEDFDDYEPDERALRIGVLRETWEETSILVGANSSGTTAAGILSGLDFRGFVKKSGIRLRLDAVVPFGHWVTPVVVSRRFDTRFYLARMPAGQVAVADGSETVGVEWVSPAAAVGAAKSGEWPIIFPTLMNLDRLAESPDTDAAFAAALARPLVTVQPVMEIQPDGSQVITIPAEAGYSVTRFTA